MSGNEIDEQQLKVAVQTVLDRAFGDWASPRHASEVNAIRPYIAIQRIKRAENPPRLEFLLTSTCYAKLQNLLELRLTEHTPLNLRGTRLVKRTVEEYDLDSQMHLPATTYVMIVPLGIAAAESPLAPRNVCLKGIPHLAFAAIFGVLVLLWRWMTLPPA